jgi:hypothetical protein
MSDTSSDRTAAIAASDAEKSALAKAPAGGGNDHDGHNQEQEDSPTPRGGAKTKMTHEEKEAARTGWRSEVQEIPKQVRFRFLPLNIISHLQGRKMLMPVFAYPAVLLARLRRAFIMCKFFYLS